MNYSAVESFLDAVAELDRTAQCLYNYFAEG
jgi:hypothetical protein